MTPHATDRFVWALTLSVVGAIVSVLVGMSEVALLLAPWMVLCALGFGELGRPSPSVHVELDDDRVMVGDTVKLAIEVRSSSPGLVKVKSRPPSRLVAVPPPAVADVVREGLSSEIEIELPADEWGAHDLGTLDVEMTDSYGLVSHRGRTRQSTIVRVHPMPRDLRELLTPRFVRRVTGTHASSDAALGVEYADIREFAPGDSVRDINWRVSARSQDVWVSQRHPDRASDVVLLVDSFVESGHDVRRIFGLVLESALALAESHLGAVDRVGLIEFGGLLRWVAPSTGQVQLQRLTDALLATSLYASAAEKQLPILPVRALPPRSFVVAFTPMLDDRFIDAVFTARARGHDVAVISCPPDQHSHSPDSDRQSGRVARALWDADREMMRDRMAERGIAVATWDGSGPIDLVLSELLRRRRRSIRTGGR